MPVSSNQTLVEAEIFPDYGRIEVSDVHARDSPDSGGRTTGAASTLHTVAVFTKSADQAMEDGQNVVVRVLRGPDGAGLGTSVFDGTLTFTHPPRLGLYQLLDDEGVEVPIDRIGPVHIQIFVDQPTDAGEVNILIRYDE